MDLGIIMVLIFLTITAWAMLFPDSSSIREMLSNCFHFNKRNSYKSLEEQYELVLAREQDLKLMLHDREEALAKALQVKQEFLNHLEHEGHTPITGIVSMGQALLANYERLSDKQLLEGLKIIASSSDRLLSFVDNLINISGLRKLTIPAYQSTKEKLNLGRLVYDRLEHCKKLYLDNKNIEFVTRIEGNITLNVNLHHLSSAIDSLIINAIKYTKEYTGSQGEYGGSVIPCSSSSKPNLAVYSKHAGEENTKEKNTREKSNQENKPQIVITLGEYQSKVEFTITDQGVGIPKEELMTIFEPFTVGSRTRTRSGDIPNGQRGIGLTLCKLAIEAHGGKIWAESNDTKGNGTKGAKFTFVLPYL